MIEAHNSDDFVGISIGETLVNSLIRLDVTGDRCYTQAVHVVDYHIAHTTDEKEIELLESLKKVMKMAKELNES